MKYRPIPYSGSMVRAVVAGDKLMTRRVVKGAALEWLEQSGFAPKFVADPENHLCPYGQPGDRLWPREAWRAPLAYELTAPRDIPPGTPIFYEADGFGSLPRFNAGKLRPGMFMPRWASRITLEVTGVRVERLQEISEADVIAEGIRQWPLGFRVELSGAPKHESRSFDTTIGAFRFLWESINGAGSWDLNPWVWVVEFKKLQPPEKGGA